MTSNRAVELPDRRRGVVRQTVVLEQVPDVLVRVDLRRVRGEVFQDEPTPEPAQQGVDLLRPVRPAAIQDHDDHPSQVSQEVPEESGHLAACDVPVAQEVDEQSQVATPGRPQPARDPPPAS